MDVLSLGIASQFHHLSRRPLKLANRTFQASGPWIESLYPSLRPSCSVSRRSPYAIGFRHPEEGPIFSHVVLRPPIFLVLRFGNDVETAFKWGVHHVEFPDSNHLPEPSQVKI
jgi:hypothetical protein